MGKLKKETRPTDEVSKWVRLGLSEDSIKKVFRLFGSERHSWVNLYRIFEVIEADIGNAKNLMRRDWASASAVTRFKRTANSVAAVGDEARHGKESTTPPKNPMTLSEARSFIETIMHHWLNERAKRTGASINEVRLD
jgi:hypothetical protein